MKIIDDRKLNNVLLESASTNTPKSKREYIELFDSLPEAIKQKIASEITQRTYEREIKLLPVAAIFLFVLVVMAATGWGTYKLLHTWSDRGAYGEVFSIDSAFFSGLAFAGFIYTILLQRSELRLQRQELELTREELSKSAKAQQNSERALATQVELLNEQIAVLRKTLGEHSSASVGERQMMADKIFMDNPHLRQYFMDSVLITKNNPDYQSALAAAQCLANYFDTFFIQKSDYHQLYGESEWLCYIKSHFSNSPLLRQFVTEKAGWYTRELVILATEDIKEIG